jgi:voltage-gated potassium channel
MTIEQQPRWKRRALELYEGETREAVRFRYGLMAFDMAAIVFIVVTSFVPRAPWIKAVDIVLGLLMLTDFLARHMSGHQRWRDLLRPSSWADIAAILSFLAPIAGEGAGFLRVLRTLRLLHTYQLTSRLRADSPYFRRHEDVFMAATHLGIFIFVMTAIVYETQHLTNPQITNYADALYFTVTALTTTGFGDITLTGTTGRMISVLIMIAGVTLFLRLASALFRPEKVRFPCPDCGLQRHEPDAVHCKACGRLLNIPDDG